VDQTLTNLQTGGNFEGKEVRFGQAASALFVVITADASCGAVNTMHDGLMAISGMVPLLNIQLGEVIFGGVGAGLYGMLMFAIIAVFIAGLMVGRTPEYLGKKIESFEMKMAMLAVLVLAADILLFTAAASVGDWGTATTNNPGPTYGPLWSGLLLGTILIVGALTYFPALALGPIVEQLMLNAGRILS
jgi:potassium-transporting ATPase potassium-binding subunit